MLSPVATLYGEIRTFTPGWLRHSTDSRFSPNEVSPAPSERRVATWLDVSLIGWLPGFAGACAPAAQPPTAAAETRAALSAAQRRRPCMPVGRPAVAAGSGRCGSPTAGRRAARLLASAPRAPSTDR